MSQIKKVLELLCDKTWNISHEKQIKKIIDENDIINLECNNKKQTLFMVFCLFGKSELVRFSLDHLTPNIQILDKFKCSSLMVASCEGHFDIVNMLLDRDATLIDNIDKNGNTALHFAS